MSYITFSAPKKEPPDRETKWIRLPQYHFTNQELVWKEFTRLKKEGVISKFAVVEFVVEDQ